MDWARAETRESGNRAPPISKRWFLPGVEYTGEEMYQPEGVQVARWKVTIGIVHSNVSESVVNGFTRFTRVDDPQNEALVNCRGEIIDNRNYFFQGERAWLEFASFNSLSIERRRGYSDDSRAWDARTRIGFSDTSHTRAVFVRWMLRKDALDRSPCALNLDLNANTCYFLCFHAPGCDARVSAVEALGTTGRLVLRPKELPPKPLKQRIRERICGCFKTKNNSESSIFEIERSSEDEVLESRTS